MADENKRIVELATAKATYEIGGGRVGLFGYENEAATLRFQYGASPTANILYVARRDAAQTFQGDQTFSGFVIGTAGDASTASVRHQKTGAHDAARWAFSSRATGDTHARFVIKEGGLFEWGQGSTRNVNLYAPSADLLKTDDVFDAASLRCSGVERVSAAGAAFFTSARVTGLTASRIVSTNANDDLVTLTAAENRALLELPPQNRSLKSGSGTGWVKFCTLKVTVQNHSAMATVDVVTAGRNLQSDRSVCRVFARIRQTSVMSSPLNIVDVRYIQQGGISPSSYAPTFGYVITQDDTSAKVVDVYLATSGSNDRFRYSVVATWSDLTANAPIFYEDSTVEVAQPVGYVAGLREDLVVESLRSNAVTADLPVYADANKTLQTEPASAFRTRIGVVGAERIDRSLKSATASGWLKLATLKATAVSHVASFMAEVISVGRSTGATDDQVARLYVRLKQNNALTGPLDIIECNYSSEGGSSFTLGYVVEQDDATEKRVSIYVGANSSTHYVRFTVLSAYSNASGNAPVFFEDPVPLASQPAPWVNATLTAFRAGQVASDTLTPGLPVYAGASKELATESASAFLTRIAAIGSVEKGAANGVAPLGADSKVSATYLPSYVDDVLEVANFAALPGTGESGKIYVTLDTNKTWRWSGSAYVEISASLVLGETSDTAYRGDRGKAAYDHSQLTGSNPHATTFAQIASKPTTLAGYGITDAQPKDADLDAIAALATTANGRSYLTAAGAETIVAAKLWPMAGSTYISVTTSGGVIATATVPSGQFTYTASGDSPEVMEIDAAVYLANDDAVLRLRIDGVNLCAFTVPSTGVVHIKGTVALLSSGGGSHWGLITISGAVNSYALFTGSSINITDSSDVTLHATAVNTSANCSVVSLVVKKIARP